MVKVVALLLLACCGLADASLGEFLKTLKGQTITDFDYTALCNSMGKTYSGYGYSMGGGATTIEVTCSGQQISLVCTGWPQADTCTSASADGDSEGGCTCAAEHPVCNTDNRWCYKSDDSSWSNTHCPGECTASADSGSCECPSSYPFCYSTNKWCYKSSTDSDYTQKCGGVCSEHAPAAPAPSPSPPTSSSCDCPSSHPFCWAKNQWCYESETSSSHSNTCAGKCTATSSTGGGGGSQVAKVGACGTSDSFTQNEAQEMLDLHNKFRCAVGTPPLQWNGALQCQAQKTQDQIGQFSHSQSYEMAISAGENLATGTSSSQAAWMWFTEYTQSSNRGHFTGMVWKETTEVGCGIQRSGDGVMRCQYAATPPNFGGPADIAANVPTFQGEESAFTKCGLTIAEVKKHVNQFVGWGILHPESALSASLGLFDESDVEHVGWTSSSSAVTMGVVFAVAAFVMMGVVRVVRRRSWRKYDGIIVAGDEEDAPIMEERDQLAAVE